MSSLRTATGIASYQTFTLTLNIYILIELKNIINMYINCARLEPIRASYTPDIWEIARKHV